MAALAIPLAGGQDDAQIVVHRSACPGGVAAVVRSSRPRYNVTTVAGKFSSAVALNDAGQIAVNNLASDVPYRSGDIKGGVMPEEVGTLGGTESAIRALNNRGEAVGSSSTADGANHAFLYWGGRIRDLTVAYGLDRATGINDRGDIVGQTDERAALVSAGGKLDVFGPPGSAAGAVNNRGDVVGHYIIEEVGIHAFRHAAGRFTDLGTIGGTFSTPTAINDAGVIVGDGSIAVGQDHAFLYDDGVIRDLTPLTRNSRANDINNLGQIVGSVDEHAFIYENGTLTDLDTLILPEAGVSLVSALAINDRGQILATACDATRTFCDSAVRLNPIPLIPEPSSFGMLLTGAALSGMHSLGRRRRS
jgi:probable HAF family extracellular repeat protein